MRFIIVAAAVFSSSAFAQSAAVFGPGGAGCASYISARRTPNPSFDAALGFWFSGFVSAHNVYSIQKAYEVKGALDFPAMFAHIDKFCRENPESPVIQGMVEIVDQNNGRKK